jgi:hypothetical protein
MYEYGSLARASEPPALEGRKHGRQFCLDHGDCYIYVMRRPLLTLMRSPATQVAQLGCGRVSGQFERTEGIDGLIPWPRRGLLQSTTGKGRPAGSRLREHGLVDAQRLVAANRLEIQEEE